MAELSVKFMPTAKLVELLSTESARGQTFVQVNAEGELILGADPHQPSGIIDFRDEVVRPIQGTIVKSHAARRPRLSRQSGKYLIDVKGTTTECRSLKEMLATGLRAFENHRPGTLERLSAIKPQTKRIVARNRNALFEGAPHLVEDCAEELMPGWWFGTNNSKDETIAWLKRGCELAGLSWGRDVSTSL